MSSIRKLISRMRNNPNSDWAFSDIRRVLEWAGCHCKEPSSGSHYKFTHPKVAKILTIPHRSPVRACYVIEALDMLDAIEEADDNTWEE